MPFTRITRLFTGSDGRSHFEDLELPMTPFALGSLRSDKTTPMPLNEFVFRETSLGSGPGFHNPPRRQFVVTLSGRARITVGDGTAREFGPGDTLFAEDLAGQGHNTQELGGERRSLILVVPDSFDIRHFLKAK
jgi:hypothetical protein